MMTAVTALSAAPAAQATTFCVPGFTTACPNNGTNVAMADLQGAMTSQGSDGMADEIHVAGGTFSTPSSFAPGGTDALTIIGGGEGSTFLTSTSVGNVYVVDTGPRGPVTMKALTVTVGASQSDGGGAGLDGDAGTVLERVTIEIQNPPGATAGSPRVSRSAAARSRSTTS